jgi:putative heme iron utilization protein
MDEQSLQILGRLIRAQRVAGFGTLRMGEPSVSLILFATGEDGATFYIHASRLAHHTQDILSDPRCSLLIAETDDGSADPQTLARVTLRGRALPVSPEAHDYDAGRSLYLRKFPESEFMFELGDFSLYRIEPENGRYVAGFARAFNITREDLRRATHLDYGTENGRGLTLNGIQKPVSGDRTA